jgi:hypothetical protein
LEALCAQKVFNMQSPWKRVGLVIWAKQKLKGDLRGIADEKIADTIRPRSLQKFSGIVMRCLAEKRAERPSMEQVIAQLKMTLQLQTSSQSSGPSSPTSLSNDDGSGPSSPTSLSDDDSTDDTSDVFSRFSRLIEQTLRRPRVSNDAWLAKKLGMPTPRGIEYWKRLFNNSG